MSGPEIAAAFGGGLIGVGVGGLMTVCCVTGSSRWRHVAGFVREAFTPPDLRSERLHQLSVDLCDQDARIASLQASLDDAHREVSRLTGEKHARDTAARVAIEALEGPYRQGETGGA